MKAQFLTPLQLQDIDGRTMALLVPLKFYSADLARIVRVDPPFVTDFASIPRGFWNVIPKNGKWDKAAVIHDAGYRLQLRNRDGLFFPATKAESDRLFLEGMAAEGVNAFQRRLMYLAVRLFGKGEFQKTESEAAGA